MYSSRVFVFIVILYTAKCMSITEPLINDLVERANETEKNQVGKNNEKGLSEGHTKEQSHVLKKDHYFNINEMKSTPATETSTKTPLAVAEARKSGKRFYKTNRKPGGFKVLPKGKPIKYQNANIQKLFHYKKPMTNHQISKRASIINSELKSKILDVDKSLEDTLNSQEMYRKNYHHHNNAEESPKHKCMRKFDLEERQEIDEEHVHRLKAEVAKLQDLVQVLRDQQYILSILNDVDAKDGHKDSIEHSLLKHLKKLKEKENKDHIHFEGKGNNNIETQNSDLDIRDDEANEHKEVIDLRKEVSSLKNLFSKQVNSEKTKQNDGLTTELRQQRDEINNLKLLIQNVSHEATTTIKPIEINPKQMQEHQQIELDKSRLNHLRMLVHNLKFGTTELPQLSTQITTTPKINERNSNDLENKLKQQNNEITLLKSLIQKLRHVNIETTAATTTEKITTTTPAIQIITPKFKATARDADNVDTMLEQLNAIESQLSQILTKNATNENQNNKVASNSEIVGAIYNPFMPKLNIFQPKPIPYVMNQTHNATYNPLLNARSASEGDSEMDAIMQLLKHDRHAKASKTPKKELHKHVTSSSNPRASEDATIKKLLKQLEEQSKPKTEEPDISERLLDLELKLNQSKKKKSKHDDVESQLKKLERQLKKQDDELLENKTLDDEDDSSKQLKTLQLLVKQMSKENKKVESKTLVDDDEFGLKSLEKAIKSLQPKEDDDLDLGDDQPNLEIMLKQLSGGSSRPKLTHTQMIAIRKRLEAMKGQSGVPAPAEDDAYESGAHAVDDKEVSFDFEPIADGSGESYSQNTGVDGGAHSGGAYNQQGGAGGGYGANGIGYGNAGYSGGGYSGGPYGYGYGAGAYGAKSVYGSGYGNMPYGFPGYGYGVPYYGNIGGRYGNTGNTGNTGAGYGNAGGGYGNAGAGYSNAGAGYGNAGAGYGNAGVGYGNAGNGYANAGSGYGNTGSGLGGTSYSGSNAGYGIASNSPGYSAAINSGNTGVGYGNTGTGYAKAGINTGSNSGYSSNSGTSTYAGTGAYGGSATGAGTYGGSTNAAGTYGGSATGAGTYGGSANGAGTYGSSATGTGTYGSTSNSGSNSYSGTATSNGNAASGYGSASGGYSNTATANSYSNAANYPNSATYANKGASNVQTNYGLIKKPSYASNAANNYGTNTQYGKDAPQLFLDSNAGKPTVAGGYTKANQNNYKEGAANIATNTQQSYGNTPQNTGGYTKLTDLKSQIYELQNVINSFSKPEYSQKPEDKDTVYKLDTQIKDLKSVINNLSQDYSDGGSYAAPNPPAVDAQKSYTSAGVATYGDAQKPTQTYAAPATNSGVAYINTGGANAGASPAYVPPPTGDGAYAATGTGGTAYNPAYSETNAAYEADAAYPASNTAYANTKDDAYSTNKQEAAPVPIYAAADASPGDAYKSAPANGIAYGADTNSANYPAPAGTESKPYTQNARARFYRSTDDANSKEANEVMHGLASMLSNAFFSGDDEDNVDSKEDAKFETRSNAIHKHTPIPYSLEDIQQKIENVKKQLGIHTKSTLGLASGGGEVYRQNHGGGGEAYNYETTNYDTENESKFKFKTKKKSKKLDLFDKFLDKILNKVVDKAGVAVPKIFELLLGKDDFNDFMSKDYQKNDYSNNYSNGYNTNNYYGDTNAMEKTFRGFGMSGFIPMIILKILAKLHLFVNYLQKFKFFKTFLIPALVLLIVAGAIVFLVWWLQPDDQHYLGYNNGYNTYAPNIGTNTYSNNQYGNYNGGYYRSNSNNEATHVTNNDINNQYSAYSQPLQNTNYNRQNVIYNKALVSR